MNNLSCDLWEETNLKTAGQELQNVPAGGQERNPGSLLPLHRWPHAYCCPVWSSQALTTDECCCCRWGLGPLLWKSSCLPSVDFGILLFWRWPSRWEPFNTRTSWEMYFWFGHILTLLQIAQGNEELSYPLLALEHELWGIQPIFALSLCWPLHSENCTNMTESMWGLPRDILMGS